MYYLFSSKKQKTKTNSEDHLCDVSNQCINKTKIIAKKRGRGKTTGD